MNAKAQWKAAQKAMIDAALLRVSAPGPESEAHYEDCVERLIQTKQLWDLERAFQADRPSLG